MIHRLKVFFHGLFVERFKKAKRLPPHELDWQSALFLNRYMGSRKY